MNTDSHRFRNYNISDYAARATTIRFRVVDNYGGGNEYFYADNVEISYIIQCDDERQSLRKPKKE